MHENEISKVVLDSAIEVHRTLGGPGLPKMAYEEALTWELRQRGLEVERPKTIPVVYKSQILSAPLQLDLLVEGKVIVSCETAPENSEFFEIQMLTYLRLTGLKLGLVVNFGARRAVDGYRRVVNGL